MSLTYVVSKDIQLIDHVINRVDQVQHLARNRDTKYFLCLISESDCFGSDCNGSDFKRQLSKEVIVEREVLHEHC